VLFEAEIPPWWTNLSFHPSGEYLASSHGTMDVDLGVVSLLPLAGGPIREMPQKARLGVKAFSPDGRLLATAPIFLSKERTEQNVIQVWDLESDEVRSLGPLPASAGHLAFDDNRYLRWSCGAFDSRERGEERIFDLENGSVEVLAGTTGKWIASVAADRTSRLVFEEGEEGDFYYEDLKSGESRRITTHGAPEALMTATFDPSSGSIVTGDADGVVRVGPVTGEDPHLLFGHKGSILVVKVSPDGRWIASGGDDGTVRLWPMPDLTKPPLHTLPHDQLIAKLHFLTNMRIVEDPESSTGWKLDYAPFPGWAEGPEW
jgi:WD40 repeat protein